SRRRHTRSYGDWSSDVCSSDLDQNCARRNKAARGRTSRRTESRTRGGKKMQFLVFLHDTDNRYFADTQIAESSDAACAAASAARSEERRVGKGCRRRWWREPSK